jgi:TPP-dependent pyruvate/acetoin dehydrogenase alpha subunit
LESYNLANVWDLPVIFVVEDNGYAESTASAWSVGGSQVKRAEAFGMPGTEVDGHDLFAVNSAAREAVARARDGGGPSLLHVKLNRYYGHFEGDAMTYRGEGEIERLREEKDSLKIFRRKVTEAGLLEASQLDEIDAEVAALIDAAVAEAEAAPAPAVADLLTDVYISY